MFFFFLYNCNFNFYCFTFSAIQPTAEGFYLPGPLWTHSPAEDPGVLLWQHPLHEGLPENSCTALQRLVICVHKTSFSILTFVGGTKVHFLVGSYVGCQMQSAARWPEIIAKSLSGLMSPTCLATFVFQAPAHAFVLLAWCWIEFYLFIFLDVLVFLFFFFFSGCLEWRGNSEVVQWSPPSQRKERFPWTDEKICWMAQECRGR